MEEVHFILTPSARKQSVAEVIAVFAFQTAVFLEPLDTVGIKLFAPDITVIASRVTTGKGMGKIGRTITRRDRIEIHPGFLQGLTFESQNIVRHFRRLELMP